MKIAIIDSGVEKKYKNNESIVGGCTFKYVQNNIVFIKDEYIDENGHGTNTFQILQHYGDEKNTYYIVKILDKNNETSIEILIQALKYLMQSDIDIIHLSLAIVEENFLGMMELKQICNNIFKKNKLLICAQKNKTNIPSYPAAFESVIGVNSIYTNSYDDIWYNSFQTIQCYANAVAKLVEGLDGKYVFFGGTSKSAAVVTGMVSKSMEIEKNYDVQDILYRLAVRHKWDIDSDVDSSKEFRNYNYERSIRQKYSSEAYSLVNRVLCEFLNKEAQIDCFKPLSEQNIFLDGEKCYTFLKALEKEFSVEIDLANIFYTSVYSFNSIIDLFLER
ncbi:minor extracellular protease Epr [Lachnospiraceae bacterium]|nr:minor extracellular protease Epr [Lachnospiraceae bacterium]